MLALEKRGVEITENGVQLVQRVWLIATVLALLAACDERNIELVGADPVTRHVSLSQTYWLAVDRESGDADQQ